MAAVRSSDVSIHEHAEEESFIMTNAGDCYPCAICGKKGPETKYYYERLSVLREYIEKRHVIVQAQNRAKVVQPSYPLSVPISPEFSRSEHRLTLKSSGLPATTEIVEHYFDYTITLDLSNGGSGGDGEGVAGSGIHLLYHQDSELCTCCLPSEHATFYEQGDPSKKVKIKRFNTYVVSSVNNDRFRDIIYKGDELLRVNGEPISDRGKISELIARGGSKVTLTFRVDNARDSQYHTDDISCSERCYECRRDRECMFRCVMWPIVVS